MCNWKNVDNGFENTPGASNYLALTYANVQMHTINTCTNALEVSNVRKVNNDNSEKRYVIGHRLTPQRRTFSRT